MIRLFRRLRTRTAAFVHDVLGASVLVGGAFYLRFNLDVIPQLYYDQAIRLLPIVFLVHGAVFWQQGLYRGVWRFASVPDLVRIIQAVVVGVAITGVVIFLWTRMFALRSVLVLQALLLIAFLSGPRLLYRWLKRPAVSDGEREACVDRRCRCGGRSAGARTLTKSTLWLCPGRIRRR